MSTSTRAGRAAASVQARQRLVRVLFQGNDATPAGSTGSVKTNSYAFSDLRKVYLSRIQDLHPDKAKGTYKNTEEWEKVNVEFHQLQDAWEKYEKMVRATQKVGNGKGEESTFTLFGVGCSFSDNEHERNLRTEITDQACRGWFSAGSLGVSPGGSAPVSTGNPTSSAPVSLIDDDMFEEVQEGSVGRSLDNNGSDWPKQRPKTLLSVNLKWG